MPETRRDQSTPQRQERKPGQPQEAGKTAQGERLKSEIDDLLDEIDEVLESNAEEFVNSYVQKGGE